MTIRLKQFLYQRYLSNKYNVLFLSNVIVNRGTIFEGYNAAYNNVKLNDTYIGLGTYIASNSTLRKTKIGRLDKNRISTKSMQQQKLTST